MKTHRSNPIRFHASHYASTALAIALTQFSATSTHAATYYWENNGSNPGFGTAAGTWAAPTTGDTTQGWSTDATGETEPVNITVAGTNGTTDAVHFGTDTVGLGLAAGTVTVSGTVTSGNMTIGSQSGLITLTGGQINFHTQTAGAIITPNNSATNVIGSIIGSSSASSALIVTGGIVRFSGNNTFNRPIRIGDSGILRFSTVGNVGAGASNLGAPSDAGRGLIQIGIASVSATLLFHDATAAQSTNRQVRIGDNNNGSGGASITNNNANAAHTLTFSNPNFNVASTGTASTFNRALSLNGVNAGDNTIAGAIIDNGASKVGLTKAGNGTWLLAGPSSYSNATTISAGVLKMGADNVLPSGTGKANINVNAGASAAGTLDLNGFNLAINGLAGPSNTVLGRVVNNATGTNKTLTVGNNNASATFNGIVVNNTSGTGTVALVKTGSGTQTLTGSNTYSGGTTVSEGTLSLSNINPSNEESTVTIATDATLNLTFDGTDTVDKLFIGATQLDEGEYGNIDSVDPVIGISQITGTGTLTVSSGPPDGSLYDDWANGVAFGGDQNGDGVSNGLAFLLGAANPTESALNKLPTIEENGGGLELTFKMLNAESRGGATLTLQHSSDLDITDEWVSVAVPDESGGPVSGVTFTITPIVDSTLNTVVATIADSEADAGKLFGRLKAENP